MLARYQVLHELGRGAIGAVYAARDRTTGAVVALKRLDPALLNGSDASLAERFLKHARSARLLSHRNIVKIDDAGEAAGTAYVAMEMLEGENLRNILERGPLPIARAIQIARDIACGLAYAHLEGVVHGAIKPSNIIVLRSGVVKITDFGIGQTGCLSYMSPEQVRGDPVDHRCDIFALGALFYEMLTHRRPFEGDSPKKITENILRPEPPLPSELNQHVPRALDGIVFSMLAGQPAARMPGVPILLRDLQRLEEGLGLGSGASAGTDEPTTSVPPAGPEPGLRTPDPQEARDASGFGIRPDSSADRDEFDYHRARMERESRRERSSRSRPAIFAALTLVLAVLAAGLAGSMGLTGFMDYWSVDYWTGHSERGSAVSRMQEAPATVPGASRPTAPAPVPEATEEPPAAPVAPQARGAGDGQAEQKSSAILSAPDPVPPEPLAAEPEQPASAGAAPTQELLPAMQPTANVADQQPGGTARLIVAVSPRGDIYVDGKHYGTTPPITTLDLEPGMHRIEVRDGARKPYLTYMTVQAGDVRRIRHDFDARGSRPPASKRVMAEQQPPRR